ncbi:MAG: hypothetical protein ACLFVJ_18655, partial [Persicimonas sp.]
MRTAILLAICLAAATLVAACATSSARADDYPYDDEVDVTFESIEVDDYHGRLEVDYRLDRDDFRWAERQGFDLWVGVYAPHQGEYTFLYSMPLQSHRGLVRFPDQVRYYDYPYVELCVIGVGVGETIDPGYGYVCESPVRVDIDRQRRVTWRQTRVVFSLGFYSSMYRYPWFHPGYGFHYPYYYYRPPAVVYRPYPYHHHHHRHFRDKSRRGDRDRSRDGDRQRSRRDSPRARPDRRVERPRPDGRIERPGKDRTAPRRDADRSFRPSPTDRSARERTAPRQRQQRPKIQQR